MRTIGQRELRNDNAEIIRGVEAGETYTITRRGVPVARLVGLAEDPDLRPDKPAIRRLRFSDLPRVPSPIATGSLLDELRGEW